MILCTQGTTVISLKVNMNKFLKTISMILVSALLSSIMSMSAHAVCIQNTYSACENPTEADIANGCVKGGGGWVYGRGTAHCVSPQHAAVLPWTDIKFNNITVPTNVTSDFYAMSSAIGLPMTASCTYKDPSGNTVTTTCTITPQQGAVSSIRYLKDFNAALISNECPLGTTWKMETGTSYGACCKSTDTLVNCNTKNSGQCTCSSKTVFCKQNTKESCENPASASLDSTCSAGTWVTSGNAPAYCISNPAGNVTINALTDTVTTGGGIISSAIASPITTTCEYADASSGARVSTTCNITPQKRSTVYIKNNSIITQCGSGMKWIPSGNYPGLGACCSANLSIISCDTNTGQCLCQGQS